MRQTGQDVLNAGENLNENVASTRERINRECHELERGG